MTSDALVRRLNQAASGTGPSSSICHRRRSWTRPACGRSCRYGLVLRDPSDPVLLTLRYAGLEDVFTIEHRDHPKTT